MGLNKLNTNCSNDSAGQVYSTAVSCFWGLHREITPALIENIVHTFAGMCFYVLVFHRALRGDNLFLIKVVE